MYNIRAFTGQRLVLFAWILTVTPCLKGSVFEVFRCRCIVLLVIEMSVSKVMLGSKRGFR